MRKVEETREGNGEDGGKWKRLKGGGKEECRWGCALERGVGMRGRGGGMEVVVCGRYGR